MAEQKVHVIPAKVTRDGWVVKEEGKDGVIQHYDTKEGAVAAAERIAEGRGLEVKIHPERSDRNDLRTPG